MVTLADFQKISGVRSRSQTRNRLHKAFNKYAAQYGVTSQEDIAKFLANICVETGGFRRLTENLNYSVDALLKKFGRHRISDADARRYGRRKGRRANQRAIANCVYGGDWGRKNLGNTEPDDGWKFRGCGPGQSTGRANAERIKNATGIDVVSDPSIMAEPDKGMKTTLALWQAWGMNNRPPIAGRRKWNGGKNGMPEFKDAYERAMQRKLSVPEYAPSVSDLKPAENDPFVAEARAANEELKRQLADQKQRLKAAQSIVDDAAAEGRISTTDLAAGGVTVTGVGTAVTKATEVVNTIAETASTATETVTMLGPWVLLGVVTAGGGWWILRERHRKKLAARRKKAMADAQ